MSVLCLFVEQRGVFAEESHGFLKNSLYFEGLSKKFIYRERECLMGAALPSNFFYTIYNVGQNLSSLLLRFSFLRFSYLRFTHRCSFLDFLF